MPTRQPRDDRKAANGTGSVFWSPAAEAYFATYTRGLDPAGRPIVKRFRARTEEEATGKRDRDRARWTAGLDTTVDVERMTVRDLFDRYLGAINRAPETLRRHRHNVALHVAPERPTATSIGHVPLARLREDHLMALYAGVADRPALASQLHATCHAALAWAVKKRRWLAENAADFVEPPRYAPPELHPPSPATIDAFFARAEATANRMLALWWFLSLTGCRPAEAMGCEWRDLEDGEWFIRRTRSSKTTRPLPIKTKEPRRVALGPRLTEILREHRKAQVAEIALAGADWDDHGLVFCTKAGRPLFWTNLTSQYFRPLLTSLALAYSPYVFFRHAAVTQMLAAGVPIQDVSFRTGHSIKTLRQFYAHRVRDRDEAAVVALEERLQQARRQRLGAVETAVEAGP